MKVTVKEQVARPVTIGDLSPGDVFMTGTTIYMVCSDHNGTLYFVNMQTGNLWSVSDSKREVVQRPRSAELVVEV